MSSVTSERKLRWDVQAGHTRALVTEPVVFLQVHGRLPADSARMTFAIGETYPVPARAIQGLGDAAMYVVSGDCLAERGLRTGDLVLIDREAVPQPGDVVAIRMGDDHTLKEWWPETDGKHVLLRAPDPKYRPIRIRFDDEANTLLGVARAWVRTGDL